MGIGLGKRFGTGVACYRGRKESAEYAEETVAVAARRVTGVSVKSLFSVG